MMTICPVCSKSICIHWPQHWVYRRGQTFYCSDQCMDVDIVRDTRLLNEVLKGRRKMGNGKITLDVKKKAVEMAINGENPLPYLKKHGAKNPSASWQYIRQTLEKNDPEKFAQLPDKLPKTAGEAMKNMKEAADEFFGKCQDMGLKVETPEQVPTVKLYGAMKIETPEGEFTDFGKVIREPRYTVTAIRYPEISEFYFDKKFNTIDWRTIEGDEVSMSPTGWKILLQDLPEIMKVLGVEL